MTTIEQAVGTNLQRLREARGLSQSELGAKLGDVLDKPWSRQAVSLAEKGGRAFAVAELFALATVLDTDMPSLLQAATVALSDKSAMDVSSMVGRSTSSTDHDARIAEARWIATLVQTRLKELETEADHDR